jgi:hypothetical protein
LRNLLEGVVGDGTLQALELKSVASGHDVVVVDDLDERLDLWVTLNAGDKGVREGVGLGALVNGLDDDDLKRKSVSGMFGGACADCGSTI